MSEDKIKEEEYQFPSEDEYASGKSSSSKDSDNEGEKITNSENVFSDGVYDQEGSRSGFSAKYAQISEKFPILNNKKVVLTTLLLVFSVIIFSFMKPNDNNMKTIKPIKMKVQSAAVKKVLPVSSVSASQLASLHQQINSGNQQVQNIADHLRDMQVTINQLTSQQNQLAGIISEQQAQIKQFNKKLIDSKKPKVPVVNYKVKAIVPGRAWLIGSDGTTITVTTGNTIPTYGKVINIDSASGVITTSSHKKIVYGQADF